MVATKLTAKVRNLASELGADLVGFAPNSRFANAPPTLSPQGLLPSAETVVVVGIHHPDAVMELSGEPDPQTIGAYQIQYWMNNKLDHISFKLGRFLEDAGYEALPLASSNIWRYAPYKGEPTEFAPDLSNIHAAVAAGLGEFGISGLFISPQYGPRVRMACIVTNAPLTPTPLYEGPPLCDKCGLCIKNCPSQALSRETKGMSKVEIEDRTYTYINKNKWRCAWGEHFDMELSLPKPERIDRDVILQELAKHGRRGGEMGSCQRFCLPPHLRVSDPEYSRVWRRRGYRKELDSVPNSTMSLKAQNIAHKGGAVAIKIQDFSSRSMAPWEKFLPRAQSVISIAPPLCRGTRLEETMANFIEESSLYIAKFTAFELAQELERAGYPTTILPDFHPFGPELDNGMCAIVLTEAKLSPLFASLPAAWEDPVEAASTWADLMGVISIEKLAEGLEKIVSFRSKSVPKLDLDNSGMVHGPVVPKVISQGQQELVSPLTLFPEMKRALVIGMHLPKPHLAYAQEGLGEAVGPYAFGTYQVWRELAMVALRVVHVLHAAGYKAIVTADPYQASRTVSTPRGRYPDATSSALAAHLAGLCDLGWHGAGLTEKWGAAQRFLTILTDAPLEETNQQPPQICDGCSQCTEACPTGALCRSRSAVQKDQLRCSWASKYGLVGIEGMQFLGENIRLEPPEEINEEVLGAAMKKRDPIQKHHTCTVEQCLKACQKHLKIHQS